MFRISFQKIKAFSLIELLISLIVISVITASFAPVVSKKLRHGNISITQGASKSLTGDCPVHQNCVLCYEKEKTTSCLVCMTNCASDEYADRANCNCVKCSSKFSGCYNCIEPRCTRCNAGYGLKDGACEYCGAGRASDGTHSCANCNGERQYAAAGASSCSDCPTGKKPNSAHSACENITCAADEYLSANSCLKCSDAFSNCKKCTASACIECEDGYKFRDNACRAVKTPGSQSDCDKFGAIYIPNSITNGVMSTTGVCMTKRNAGDPDGPTVDYSGVISIISASTAKTAASCPDNTACCWSGAGTTKTTKPKEGDTSYCTGTPANSKVGSLYSKFDYEGCKRTVCNYAAAQIACNNYKTEKTVAGDWSLPDSTIASFMAKTITNIEPCPDPDATAVDGDGDKVSKYPCNGPKFSASTAVSYIQNYKGANGIQLCDGASGGGAGGPRCYLYSKACKGSYFLNEKGEEIHACVPEALWLYNKGAFSYTRAHGRVASGSSVCYNSNNTREVFGTFNERSAFSVRCILKNYVE